MGIDPTLSPLDMLLAARESWDLALSLGEKHGYRNAQATVLAPTGTIGLLMDCDTTGVEPDFALVKFKKLAGGGYFKIVNQSVAPALRHLGLHRGRDLRDREVHRRARRASTERSPHQPGDAGGEGLHRRGDRQAREAAAHGVRAASRLQRVRGGRGRPAATRVRGRRVHELGLRPAQGARLHPRPDPGGQRRDLRSADHRGRPHLRDEHLSVFDTANKNGKYGSGSSTTPGTSR
jgi:ribonucleoside-diphosphate reductase alpha chain